MHICCGIYSGMLVFYKFLNQYIIFVFLVASLLIIAIVHVIICFLSVDVGIIGQTTLKPLVHFYDDSFIFVFLNSYCCSSKLPQL